MKKIILFILLLLVILPSVNATSDFTNLNQEISNAIQNEDYILNITDNYTYNPETDNEHLLINTTNNFTIIGNGYTIDANHNNRIFEYIGNKNLYITDLNLINAETDDFGGAILTIDGTIIVNNSNFISNKVTSNGGAIYAENGDIYINNSQFDSNYATSFAGAVNTRYGNLYVSNSNFTNNYARTGGAIGTDGKYTQIINSILKNNSADLAGAICTAGSLEINNSHLINNHANQINDLIAKNYININNNWYGNNTPFENGNNRITTYIITDSEQFIPYTPNTWKTFQLTTNKENYTLTEPINIIATLNNYNNKTKNTTLDLNSPTTFITLYSTNNLFAEDNYPIKDILNITPNITTNISQEYNITGIIDNQKITRTINLHNTLKTQLTTLNLNKKYNDPDNLTGTLKDENNSPLSNQEIKLNITRTKNNASKIYTLTTNNNGEYQLPINLAKGTYTVETYYTGNEIYLPSNTNSTIEITEKTTTKQTVEPYTHNETKNTYNLTGKLTDNYNNPLNNENIKITLKRLTNNLSKTYTVNTNTEGVYNLPINLAKGTYQVNCTYEGTTQYESSYYNITIYII